MQDLSIYNDISKSDYESLAGENWPIYEDFVIHKNIPLFVYNEIDSLLKNVTKFNNDAFCVLPFYGVEYPLNAVCCIMEHPSIEVDDVKQSMLNGIRHPRCNACWKLEDQNLVSDRILKNSQLDIVTNNDLTVIEEQCRLKKNSIIHYKIDTSNTCNATCITCAGHASTAWIKLEKKHNFFKNKPWQLSLNELDINYTTAKSINFRGGESLLSANNFLILEKLIEHKNTDCFISFTTNGSVKLTNKQIALLSNFKNIAFCLSIDGVGPVFEYLRFPLQWEILLENINQYRQNNIKLSVSYTISNLNIMYYTETINWFKSNDLPYLNNVVSEPRWFQPSSLPKSIKDQIVDDNTTGFLNNHHLTNDLYFEEFIVKIKEQDQWKEIEMKNYLPEFYNLIKEYL